MSIGFAGIYGAIKTKPAAFMCLLIALYEILFVYYGTDSHEKELSKVQLHSLPEMSLKMEELEKLKEEYLLRKSRFNDPSDKVFKNDWFKKKFLDPSWNSYQNAGESLTALKNIHQSGSINQGQMWLKLLYRLCAVVFLMILSGLAIRKLKESFACS